MESKKINQLATEMSPAASDLTIIGDPITGVSKKITLEQISSLFSSSISFYSNYASFPATGSVDTLYCAKDTNKLYLWNGSAYVQTFPSQALLDTYQLRSEKSAANGYASLDGSGKVPSAELPSYVDDIIEVANYASLPVTGETGKIYITLDNNKIYRWSGSIYVEIASNNAIWGSITGTLSNQTDLQNALNTKQNTITLTTTGTSGASTLVGSTLNIPNYSPDLSGYVPYTGATANLDLGTFDLTTDIVNLNQLKAIGSGGLNIYSNSGTHIALMGGGGGAGTTLYGGLIATTASFASSGGSDTFAINHSSGSGIALNITKGGNGEGLYINKTSGSGNAATIIGTLNATTLVKSGGTSSQFLKADGTVDSSTYALDSLVVHLAGTETITGNKYYTARQYFEDYPIYSESGISLDNRLSGTNSSNSTTLCGDVNGLQINLDGGGYNHLAFASTTVGNTYTFPNATGTIALTSDLSSYVPTSRTLTINGTTYDLSANRSWTITAGVSSVTATSPLFSSGGATPDITIQVANTSQSGYLSSTDWNTFNGKQAQINGTGFVKASGTTISYDNSTYLTTSAASSTYLPLAGGTLTGALNGTSATFSSDNNNLSLNNPSGNYSTINFKNGGTTKAQIFYENSTNKLWLSDYLNILASTGAATFSTNVGIGMTPITANGGLQIGNSGGAAPSIYFTKGTTAAYFGVDAYGTDVFGGGTTGSYPYIFVTNSTERMRITSGNSVLINRSSNPYESTYRFIVKNTTDQNIGFGLQEGELSIEAFNDAISVPKPLRLYANKFSMLGGNVLIGTTTSVYAYANRGVLELDGATNALIGLTIGGTDGGYLYHNGADLSVWNSKNGAEIFATNNTERMRITSGGEVCINTTTSSYKFAVNGSAQVGSLNVGNLGTGTVYSSSGSLTNTNPSDRRLKENINSISYGLNEILQLNPVSFDWKNDNNKNKQFGFIAQEVKEIMPEAIIEGEYLGLEKDAINTALVNAIKELEARLKTLENK
jgi:hypothetical protein